MIGQQIFAPAIAAFVLAVRTGSLAGLIFFLRWALLWRCIHEEESFGGSDHAKHGFFRYP